MPEAGCNDPNGRIRQAFLRACAWDVAVRKPGNVSRHSPGHGMAAQDFLASAEVAAAPLCEPGRRVGERIEAAMQATWARVGCNTNLGILLLCAPLAAAAEPISLANPGGLGRAEAQDVREAPQVTLREAMALAADRDRIARQYRDGMAELFELGLAALDAPARSALLSAQPESVCPGEPAAAALQRIYLAWLASAPDSHLVRKFGPAVAQVVLSQARPWAARAAGGEALEADDAFCAWDEALKAGGLNPGSSADLTVATLMALFLCTPRR
jgi:triphosphoribosyl-dephospho-CoA synthase